MADLIKQEPGKSKLYLGCEDDEVDGSPQEFTWPWIKQATGLRVKDRFKKHLEDGHFGEAREAGGGKYYLTEGHRDICRFNNKRWKTSRTIIMSMDDYEDSICGREPKDGKVTVRGLEYTGKASLKSFDPEEFLALPRYTRSQCKMMATERVENDIKSKSVPWYDFDENGSEYKLRWNDRYKTFYEMLRKEMVLVARRGASEQQIEDSIDLPPSILALITGKLTEVQAEFFIARMVEFISFDPAVASNPILSHRVGQVIHEEINIEHLRDLQRLHGDKVDKGVEKSLNDALKRHRDLLPMTALTNGAPIGGETGEAPPTKTEGEVDYSGEGRNADGMH